MPVDLLIDRRGYLWVGGRSGLYRYDGYEATLFQPDPGDPGTITDLDIRALYEDSGGIIWVATNTGGLNRLDPRSGRFSHFRHRPGDPATLSHDSVYGMAEGPEGDLWVGTQIGLNRIERETGGVTRYMNDSDDPASLAHDYVFSVYRDKQGVLWVATIGGGLNRYNTVTDDFSRFDLAELTAGSDLRNDVFLVAEDSSERLWIGTRAGLLRLDRSRVNVEVIELGLPGAEEPTITELLIDAADNVWLGTFNQGLIRIDGESEGRTVYKDYNDVEIGGLASQPVLSIAMAQDRLFVGTWGGGLWSGRIPQADFGLFGADDAGLGNELVMAIAPGVESGQPLVGSFGGGLRVLDARAGEANPLPEEDPRLADTAVLGIARTGPETLFLATSRGLYRLDDRGRMLAAYEHRDSDAAGIGEGYVTSLLPDGGSLWVGVGGSGVHRLDIESGEFARFAHDPDDPNSVSGDYVTSLLAEGRDYLWVGTRSNGLNRCRLPGMECRRFTAGSGAAESLGHFHVTALYRDGRGRVWVATDGGGLHEVQTSGAGAVTGFRRWTEADGLLSNSVMAIEEDSDGSLWLSTRRGLTRLDPDQGRVVSYVEAGGLPVGHFNANAAARDDEFIYFGSVDGLLAVPRGRPFETREASPVRITGIEKIGDENVRPATGWVPDAYESRYGDILAIGFATLDYAEVPHQYEFRLASDEEWSPLGQRNEVTLLKLAPGSYRFMARGRDVFGQWSESPAVQVEVVPPFWMTLWFRVLLLVVLVAAAFGAHRLRTARLTKLALEVERLGARREEALEKALGGKAELAGLTPRQKEVLQLIAEGCSTREIAERLDVSIKTVEAHRAHLMDRLDIRDVPGLVRLAIRAGLVSPHD
jgi:ligand-binding sensor domain-containing protein/DNA-binding CsgD family transcriptional regulator